MSFWGKFGVSFILMFNNFSFSSAELFPIINRELCEKSDPNNAAQKLCNLRGSYLTRPAWKHHVGYNCYFYTDERIRLNFRYANECVNYTGIPIYVGVLNPSEMFLFDYENEESLTILEESFKSKLLLDKWVECSRNGLDCCDHVLNDTNIWPNDPFKCPAEWDAWSCILPAVPNTVQKQPCPQHVHTYSTPSCILESEKTCWPNGTWNPTTFYGSCSLSKVYLKRNDFHILALSVGTVLSLPAVLVFVRYAAFRNSLRTILHRNFIAVVIIRNLLTIMVKKLVLEATLSSALADTVLSRNSAACRVLAFFENAAKNGMYACMLADGYHYHKEIARTFQKKPNIYAIYAVVLGLTFGPSLVWAAVKASLEDAECWMVDQNSFQWITDSVRITILVINLILLIDLVVRYVLIKRARQELSTQIRQTLQTSLLLMPIFGIQFFFILNRNLFGTNTSCSREDVYYYVSYTIEGLQGVLVALNFCYLNSEVHSQIGKDVRKVRLFIQQKYGDLK